MSLIKLPVEIECFHRWELRLNLLKIYSLWDSTMTNFTSINDLICIIINNACVVRNLDKPAVSSLLS